MIFKFFKHKPAAAQPAGTLPDLGPATAALNQLAGGIDQSFVEIITAVMAYQGRARELCQESSSLLEHLGAGEMQACVAEIGSIVDLLEQGQQDFSRLFEQRITRLGEVLAQLDAIESAITETENMLKALDMLGFMTRVEDARLVASDFNSLADEVRELSRQITSSQRLIGAQVKDVSQRLKAALKRLNQLEGHRRGQTGAIQLAARAALAELGRHYTATGQALDTLTNASAGLDSDFARIVIELQINDIVRQKLEHVTEALAEIRPEQFYGVVELQCQQLERTADELSRGLNASQTATDASAARIAAVVAALGSLGDADQGGNRIQVSIEQIKRLIEAINANSTIRDEMDQTLASLWSALAAIAQHVDDIKVIGFKMQLIALNSRIKAASLGSGGRVLESISGAIYAISLGARDQTDALAGRIAELKLERAEQPPEQTGFSLEATTARLMGLEAELGQALVKLGLKSAGFGEGFELIRARLSAAERMPQAILNEQAGLAACLADLPRPADQGDLSILTERYTMHSERAVHFQADQAEDDLGCNVELF